MADDEIIIEERTIPSTVQNNDNNGSTFRIPIKLYKPPSSIKIKASVFFIHGGIFALGNRDDHPTIAMGLAKLGLVVVTASFRNGSEAPHKTGIAMKDLQDVVDFVRGEWKGVPFGLVGSSSVSYFVSSIRRGCIYLVMFDIIVKIERTYIYRHLSLFIVIVVVVIRSVRVRTTKIYHHILRW